MPTTDMTTQTQAASRLAGASVQRPSQTPSAVQRAAETPSRTLDPTGRQSDPLSVKELTKAVDHLNSLVQQVRRELRFSVDDHTGKVVIKVLDSQTDEVVRQIPSDQVLSLLEHFEAANKSLLLDVTA